MLTYTFKIKTTKSLETKFIEHQNTTRALYNLAKETKEYAYSKGTTYNKFDLIKQLPELKKEFKWLNNVHSQTLQGVIERLDNSYMKYFDNLKKGEVAKAKTTYINKQIQNGLPINPNKLRQIGKPNWAKKNKWDSVEFKKSAVVLEDNRIKISKIGSIKFFKSREINGELKLARIVKKADGWYLQIVTDYTIEKCNNQAEVGCDVGIKHFLVTSEGEYFENIKTKQRFEKELKVAQRSLSRKIKFSNNFYKQVEKVKKIHLKIKRVREDYLHKISSNLASNYQYVFVEDLEVSDMVRNKEYSKAISDVSWSKFFSYLEYKTELIKVDAKYTSQECNNCGHISKENRKTQSKFKCVKCDFEGNADYLACKNILKRGQTLLYAKTSH